jgi:hypothetical protein
MRKWLMIVGIAFIALGAIDLLYRYYIRGEKQVVLSYKGCKVTYKYYGEFVKLDIGYIQANRKLATCLCEQYGKTPDTATAKRIQEMYTSYAHQSAYFERWQYEHTKSVDTLVKYKQELFAPTAAF